MARLKTIKTHAKVQLNEQNIQKLQKLQNVQNMNYGNSIYDKIKRAHMFIYSSFCFVSKKVRTVRMHFCSFGVFCTIDCYFEYVYRILCIFLYI